jgi:tetratricopeptide (TPR) repeat protein
MHGTIAKCLREQATRAVVGVTQSLLAHHCFYAHLYELAAVYALAAADQAMLVLSLDSARLQYVLGLKALDQLSLEDRDSQLRWCDVAHKLGFACVFDPLELEDGQALFERALGLAQRASHPGMLAKCYYWLAYIDYARGRLRAAITNAKMGRELAQQVGDDKLAAQIDATLGQAYVSAGMPANAKVLLEGAITSKRQMSSATRRRMAVGSAYSLARCGFMAGHQGDFEQAHEHIEQALELLAGHQHPVAGSIYELQSVVYLWQGDWVAACTAAERGCKIATQCRSRYLLAMGQSFRACANWMLHKENTYIDQLRAATDWIERRGGAISSSICYAWLLQMAVDSGDTSRLREDAKQLIRRVQLLDVMGAAAGCRAMAQWAWQQGHLVKAKLYLARAHRYAVNHSSMREMQLSTACMAQLMTESGRQTLG